MLQETSEHSYKDHMTNEEVRNRIQNAIGVHNDLLTMIKKGKLRWYGHISRSSGMAKTILQWQWNEQEKEEDRRRDGKIIKEWTGMGFGDSQRAAEDREGWKGIVATSTVVPRRPTRLRGWDEMRWSNRNWINVKEFEKISTSFHNCRCCICGYITVLQLINVLKTVALLILVCRDIRFLPELKSSLCK